MLRIAYRIIFICAACVLCVFKHSIPVGLPHAQLLLTIEIIYHTQKDEKKSII